MLIQHATQLDGSVVDIRLGERITDVADRLTPRRGESVLDARLGTVIPGLHDHHVHLYSAAAALDSVWVGPADVGGRQGLARTLSEAQVGSDGWIRAVGYHEAVAGPLDRTVLDTLSPSVPLRIQHRSGVLWMLNSAGLARVGLADHPDGRLRSTGVWAEALQRRETALAELSNQLAGYGVTGITDATPDLGIGDLVKIVEEYRHGVVHQHVHCLAPGKRILHDDGLDLDELTAWIADRHDDGGPVALHCVTTAQLVVAMAALRAAGRHPRDRIEHAAMVPDDCLADLAGLGITVVTQPNFIAERGEQYRTDVPAAEHHQLWRVASLVDAGVQVALSTDMPFGHSDPWAAMRAAVTRQTATGVTLGPQECVTAARALGMFLGTPTDPAQPRTVARGQPGDVCVLAATPAAVLHQLDKDLVRATVVAGAVVFDR